MILMLKFNNSKELSFIIAVILSILIHISFLVALRTSPHSDQFKSPHYQKKTILEFIPSLNKPAENPPEIDTNLISEKNMQSQNPIDKPKLPKNKPHQQGPADHPSLARKEITSIAQPQTSDMTPKPETSMLGTKQIKESLEQKQPTPPSINAQDKITSPAARNINSASEIIDEWSYNANSHAVAEYLSDSFIKISNLWRFSLYTETVFPYGLEKTVIGFKILPNGEIDELQVVYHKGDLISQRYAIDAVTKTAPFPPLPDDVKNYIRDDGLWVIMNFNYKENDQ